MQNLNQKITKLLKKHWLAGYAVIILIFAFALNFSMEIPITSFNRSLGADNWLVFWGSYLGGALGCIPALAALLDNRREADRQHEESEKSRRLSTLPVFSCAGNPLSFVSGQPESVTTLSGLIFLSQEQGLHGQFSSWKPEEYAKSVLAADKNHVCLIFELRNIGAGPALNVSLTCAPSGPIPVQSIGAGEKSTLILGVHVPPDADQSYLHTYTIQISFSDVFGNRYVQLQPLKVQKTAYTLAEISTPELIEQPV